MEFDDLKRAWEECDSKLNTAVHVNERLLRSATAGNGDTALNRMATSEIDYTAPVAVVQRQLRALHIARSRSRKWILGPTLPACTLMVILAIESVAGVNVSGILAIDALVVAFVFGVMAAAAWMKRSYRVCEFDREDVIGKLHATLLRALHRHRVLRG